jgi:hypothetical protein
MNDELIKYLVGAERFTDVKGYKFDKLIFGGFILLVLALFVILFLSYGSDRDYHIYYNCPLDYGSCKSPFYHNYPLCESAWATACDDYNVNGGFVFGEPAPWIIKSWGLIVGIMLFGAFVINHFVHNRGKTFDFEDGEQK